MSSIIAIFSAISMLRRFGASSVFRILGGMLFNGRWPFAKRGTGGGVRFVIIIVIREESFKT